jgi:hypothetical protein
VFIQAILIQVRIRAQPYTGQSGRISEFATIRLARSMQSVDDAGIHSITSAFGSNASYVDAGAQNESKAVVWDDTTSVVEWLKLEAGVGIEPTNNRFAGDGLTAWLSRQLLLMATDFNSLCRPWPYHLATAPNAEQPFWKIAR